MPFIRVKDSLNTGIKELDDYRVKMIDIINRLHDSMKKGRAKEIMTDILNEMIDCADKYFSAEEKYMRSSNYPGYNQHKSEHENFVRKLNEIKDESDLHKFGTPIKMISFFREWFLAHMVDSDIKTGAFLKEKGVK